MTDISITAANILKAASDPSKNGIAGEAITAGEPLYKDATDSDRLKLCDSSGLATAACVGIALHGADTGQPITYMTSGVMTLNAVAIVGEIYCVSTTAGGIAPEEDVTTGLFRTVLGTGITSTTIKVNISVSGIAIP